MIRETLWGCEPPALGVQLIDYNGPASRRSCSCIHAGKNLEPIFNEKFHVFALQFTLLSAIFRYYGIFVFQKLTEFNCLKRFRQSSNLINSLDATLNPEKHEKKVNFHQKGRAAEMSVMKSILRIMEAFMRGWENCPNRQCIPNRRHDKKWKPWRLFEKLEGISYLFDPCSGFSCSFNLWAHKIY